MYENVKMRPVETPRNGGRGDKGIDEFNYDKL
jgi:hypothetical protein